MPCLFSFLPILLLALTCGGWTCVIRFVVVVVVVEAAIFVCIPTDALDGPLEDDGGGNGAVFKVCAARCLLRARAARAAGVSFRCGILVATSSQSLFGECNTFRNLPDRRRWTLEGWLHLDCPWQTKIARISSKKNSKKLVSFFQIRARCLFAVGLQYRPYELNLSTLCTVLED